MSRLNRDAERAAHIANEHQSEASFQIRNQKFMMFFAGLIFAVLSFMGAHPINTTSFFLKALEAVSMLSLLFSGLFLLTELAVKSNIMTNKFYLRKIGLWLHNKGIDYWTLFIVGMVSMIADRSIMLFLN